MHGKRVEMETRAMVNYSRAAFFPFAHKELSRCPPHVHFSLYPSFPQLHPSPLTLAVRENVQPGSRTGTLSDTLSPPADR